MDKTMWKQHCKHGQNHVKIELSVAPTYTSSIFVGGPLLSFVFFVLDTIELKFSRDKKKKKMMDVYECRFWFGSVRFTSTLERR